MKIATLQSGSNGNCIYVEAQDVRLLFSNDEAAELLAEAGKQLKWACLAHLSERNNDPRIAERTHRRLLGTRIPLRIANRHDSTEMFPL